MKMQKTVENGLKLGVQSTKPEQMGQNRVFGPEKGKTGKTAEKLFRAQKKPTKPSLELDLYF